MANAIKLLIDLDARFRNLLGLNKNLGSTAAHAQRAQKGLNEVTDASNRANGAFGGLSSMLGRFGERMAAQFSAQAALAGLEHLATGAFRLGKEILHTVATAERVGRAFETLFKPQEAEDLLGWIEQIAVKSEFDDGPLKSFALGLRRAGVEAKNIPDMLRAGMDLAALSGEGDPVAALAAVGDAFEMMATKGELNFKMLGKLGITKPEMLQDLATATGLGVKDVEKALTDGTIKLEMLNATMYAAISRHTGKDLGQEAADAGKGLGAVMDRLSNVPSNLFEELAKSPASKGLADQIGALAKQLAPDGPIGSQLVTQLTALFEKVTAALEGVDLGAWVARATVFIEDAILVFNALAAVAKGVAWVFETVGTFLGQAAAECFLWGEKVYEFFDTIGTAIGEGWAQIYLFFEELLATPGRMLSKMFDVAKVLGTEIWQGIKDGLWGGLGAIEDAISGLATGAIGKLKGLLGIASPSQVFAGLGEMTGEGYARGLAGTERRVQEVVDQTFDVSATQVAAPAAGLGGGPVSINVPITVNYSGAGGEDEARALAAHIRDLLPGQLQAAFEQLRVEMGAT